jgi:hypothetical protein
MLDFTSNELFARATQADRLREARSYHPSANRRACALRPTLASWAAGLALAIDREVARRRIDGQPAAGGSV